MKATTTMLVLLLFLSGCSNDSVFEGISDNSGRKSVIEEATIALDGEDYASAIQMLTEIYTTTSPDPEMSRLLSSAYLGRSGFDFVSLIEYSGDKERENFDMVAESLSLGFAPVPKDDNDESLCSIEDRTVLVLLKENDRFIDDYPNALFIDGRCIGDLIDSLEEAQYILDVLIRANRHTPDDEILLGVASAVHFVFYTGNKVADGLNRTLLLQNPEQHEPGIVPVPINKEAYLYYINFYGGIQYSWGGVDPGDFRDETTDDLTRANTYQKDLINIYRAVQAFHRATPEENDVRDALQDFLASTLDREGATISEFDEDDIISTMTTAGVYNFVNSFSAE